MRIGPLVSQSTLIPFVAGFITALDYSGVMRGMQRFYPQQTTAAGGIRYGATEALHIPMLRVDLGRTRAVEEYEAVSQSEAPEDSPFLRDAGQIDAIFRMNLADVADALERPEVLGGTSALPVPEMAERLRFLGTMDLGQLLRHRLGIEELGMRRLPINARVFKDAAQIVDFMAQSGGARPAPFSEAEAGAFSFISGLLSAGLGTKEGNRSASTSFLWSAAHYLRAGSPVAAAIAAETAGLLIDSLEEAAAADGDEAGIMDLEEMDADEELDDEEMSGVFIDQGNQGFLKAAFYWKAAAEKLRDEKDGAGFWLAVTRGIIAAEASLSTSAKPIKIALHGLAAEAQHRPGHLEQEGQEWLRAAAAEMSDFEGSPASWETIGKLLQHAVSAYRESGDCAPLLDLLEDLERQTEAEGRTHFNDLKLLDLAIEEQPKDANLIHRRAMLRLKHGNFNGSLEDMWSLNDLHEGNPWFVSDLGLIYHHFAHLYSVQGEIEAAREMLQGAQYYLDTAMKIVKINGIESDPEFSAPIAQLYARRGALRATTGRVVQAISDFEKAMALSPKDPEIPEYLRAVKRYQLTRVR